MVTQTQQANYRAHSKKATAWRQRALQGGMAAAGYLDDAGVIDGGPRIAAHRCDLSQRRFDVDLRDSRRHGSEVAGLPRHFSHDAAVDIRLETGQPGPRNRY